MTLGLNSNCIRPRAGFSARGHCVLENFVIVWTKTEQGAILSMRFFHLSDLHIGLRLYNRDLREDQEYILNEIIEKAQQYDPDAVLIAGDIYDKAIPSAEAVEVFDHFVSSLARAVPDAEIMMISGNHDSGPRVNVFRSVLARHRIHMIGNPPALPGEHIEKVTLQDTWGPVNFYLLPFIRPSMVKLITGTDDNGLNLSYDMAVHRIIEGEALDPAERNVLVSHQFYLPAGTDPDSMERMESEVVTVGNIDQVKADVLERFDYAALGHIHKPMKAGGEFYRYPGTPLACSVSEAGQKKGILMVDMKEKGNTSVTVLPLIPLREVRVIKGTLSEVLPQACEDYVTVILTDEVDLDVFDMQDRLRSAFPNLLEIRREALKRAAQGPAAVTTGTMDPMDLCCEFIRDPDEAQKILLQDVINSVLG